ILFLAAVLIPLTALAWAIAFWVIQTSMADEFTSKGAAIAISLAGSGVDPILNRDASTVQSLVDKFPAINGVAYVLVYGPSKKPIAHTFTASVPAGIIEENVVPGTMAKQVRDIAYTDPSSGARRQVIDVGVPILGGQLGTVRVGMDQAIITAAAVRSANSVLLVFAAGALLAGLVGIIFVQRITSPVAELGAIARRVGRGDLTKLAPVTSLDEMGQLAESFNQSVVRLRSLVQTEEHLQQNITRLLHTVREISEGDLTKRGAVT